jgi:hypothetical protein
MTDDTIFIDEIFGKTITDIRCVYGQLDGWLDTAECFIELDHKFYIEIPHGFSKDVLLLEPDPEAKTIFGNLSDIPICHINKEGKSISEVEGVHRGRKINIFHCMRNFLFGHDLLINKYKPDKVEYFENPLMNIINRTIIDYWWKDKANEKGFYKLDNGYFISDQYTAPTGTGLAGLHYYDSINSLKHRKGPDFKCYSNLK